MFVIENDYQRFLVTESVSPTDGHHYQKVQLHAKNDGVVAVISTVGGYVLLKHQRLGQVSLECVRGFLEVDETPVEGAIREVREELGLPKLAVSSSYEQGIFYTDNAFSDQKIHVVLLQVDSLNDNDTKHVQCAEDVLERVWVPAGDLAETLVNVSDGFTLSAFGRVKTAALQAKRQRI